MKKKFIISLLFILINTVISYSQIGIRNTNPDANLAVHGTMRLEHYTQGEGKVLVSNATGDVRWAAPFSLRYVSGRLAPAGEYRDIVEGNPQYTRARITLAPGGWLFKSIILLNNRHGNLAENQTVFATVYLSDSATDPTYSADYIDASARDMSGSLIGPSTYGLIDGAVVIRNTSTASKTYYLWGKLEYFTDNSNSPTRRAISLNNVATDAWGENVIYAIPIE